MRVITQDVMIFLFLLFSFVSINSRSSQKIALKLSETISIISQAKFCVISYLITNVYQTRLSEPRRVNISHPGGQYESMKFINQRRFELCAVDVPYLENNFTGMEHCCQSRSTFQHFGHTQIRSKVERSEIKWITCSFLQL